MSKKKPDKTQVALDQMVALRDGQPRLLNLKEILEAFVKHRREVVTRRTSYELRKARERAPGDGAPQSASRSMSTTSPANR